MRPSRREGEAIFPSLRSSQTEIVVVLDTSGSIKAQEMREFVTEVDAIKGQMRARITLQACDAELSPAGPWVYEPWEEFDAADRTCAVAAGPASPRCSSGWTSRAESPDLLVYFTDAEGEFPKQEPRTPVLWLVKGRAKVPWGQRVQLN